MPGPNQTYLAALTLGYGIRAGLAAVAGIALGLSIYGLAAALGVAAIIHQSETLYEILRWTSCLPASFSASSPIRHGGGRSAGRLPLVAIAVWFLWSTAR